MRTKITQSMYRNNFSFTDRTTSIILWNRFRSELLNSKNRYEINGMPAFIEIVGRKKDNEETRDVRNLAEQPRATAVVMTLTVLLLLLSSRYHHMVAWSGSASQLRLSSDMLDSFLERIRQQHKCTWNTRRRDERILVDKNTEKETTATRGKRLH